jgi:hypothetical protein
LDYLAKKLSGISADDRKVIVEGMAAIRSVLMSGTGTSGVVK